MPTLKDKFALLTKLQALGFTFEESQQLRRIQLTLRRWAELECGTDRGHVERAEKTGKPAFHRAGWQTSTGWYQPKPYSVADREAGALKRLAFIVEARNERQSRISPGDSIRPHQGFVIHYHQSDPRGCALYLITRAQLGDSSIDSVYNRGLAVCV